MFRFKFQAMLVALAIFFLWPSIAAAADPNPRDCNYNCYAYNRASFSGDGTEETPWLWDKANDPYASRLRTIMGQAVRGKRSRGYLNVTDCTGADQDQCKATLYIYDRNGNETSQVGIVSIPDVGVPLPFHFILIFGALLAVLLVAGGLFLRRRTQQAV